MSKTATYLDSVAFGRWASEHRREMGWPSQRALADAAENDPLTSGSGITESFLARLEAGVLVWPPRGDVRRRVLELAWFFCETPGAVTPYLQLSGCAQLGDEERALVVRITSYITATRASAPLLLPPRPRRLIGRESQVDALLQLLLTPTGGCFAVTGMVGVGKSALAAEAVHRVASDRRRRAYYFPDGILCLSTVHRHGLPGLLGLLDEVCALCMPAVETNDPAQAVASRTVQLSASPSSLNGMAADTAVQMHTQSETHPRRAIGAEELAAAINRTRVALAGKRMLLLIDDLDPQFPLAAALDALLPGGSARGVRGEVDSGQCVMVLVTSRAAPDPTLVTSRLHLLALDETSSVALLATLIGRPLSEDERPLAASICAALGNLPLAIEQAGSAMSIEGIPIELLARLLTKRPLDRSWRGGAVLRERIADALTAVDADARAVLALLPLIGSRTFSLATAASLEGGAAVTKTAQADLTQSASMMHQRMAHLPSPLRADTTPINGMSDQCADDIEQTTDAASHLPACDDEVADGEDGVRPPDASADGEVDSPLASIAAILGQLVRNSLLELVPPPGSADLESAKGRQPSAAFSQPRYEVSPVLHAWAQVELPAMEPTRRERAYQNLQAYIRTLAERLPSTENELAEEWPVVWSAFSASLRRGDDQQVLDVASALARCTPTLLRFQEQSSLILDAGIAAGRRGNDRLALSRLLSRVGVYQFYRGSIRQARQAWDDSIEIGETLPLNCRFNTPLYNLGILSLQMGEYAAAQRYLERFMLCAETAGHSGDLAAAYSVRAEAFRMQGATDRALTDLVTAAKLLVASGPKDPAQQCPWLTSFALHLRLERARVLGQYDRVRALAEEIAHLSDTSIVGAQMALDQAEYALSCGVIDDARRYALQVAHRGRTLRSRFFVAHAQSILERAGASAAG